MLLHRNLRVLATVAASLVTLPAWSQSFQHAPAGAGDEPLLPIISPGRLFRTDESEPPADAPQSHSRPSIHPASPTASAQAGGATGALIPSAIAPPATFTPDPAAKPILPAAPGLGRWVRMANAGGPAAPPPVPAAEAIENSPAAQTFVPATAAAARTLAARQLAEGNAGQAEATLSEAAARFADDMNLAVTLARLRETREDWTGAAAAYEATLRLRPEEPQWQLRRAECLYHAGAFEAAVADYAAVAVEPDALTLGEYARFGDAALRTGDPATAEAAFTALSRAADEPIARVELLRGMAALKQGEAERARGILLRASARWPDDPALIDALRLAAAMHYGDAGTMTAETRTPNTIVATSAESPAAELPPTHWRPAADATRADAGWRVSAETVNEGANEEPAPLP